MNKTLYIRDEDAPVWDRARELADEKKLSPVIVDALKKFIAEREAEARGFERIVIEYEDHEDNDLPHAKAFYGRWIFPLSNPLVSQTEEGYGDGYVVAVTAKGNVVIHGWSISRDEDVGVSYRHDFWFRVYKNFEEAAADKWSNWPARRALQEIGIPVEELDI